MKTSLAIQKAAIDARLGEPTCGDDGLAYRVPSASGTTRC